MANCDLCGGGFGCAGRGPVEAKRWIRGRTEGDNLITAFYLLSSSSSTLAGSLAPSPTSCHYGNPEPCKKTSATVGTERRPGGQRGDPAVSAETDTCSGCVEIKTDDRLMLMTEAGAATHHVV